MKNFNKKLTLFTILFLGASIAQPSGIFTAAKSKLISPLFKAYQERLARNAYLGAEKQTEISAMFATLLEDTNNQNNLHRLPERVSNLAYAHTKTVEAFGKKAKSDNRSKKARNYFYNIISSASGIALGFVGSKIATLNDQLEKPHSTENECFQRTFAVLSKSSNHLE